MRSTSPAAASKDAIAPIRAKLWRSGYPLSTKKVNEFLDYIADTNMADSVDEMDDGGDHHEEGQHAVGLGARQPRGRVELPAEARVDRLERDVQALERAATAYIATNAFPFRLETRLDMHTRQRPDEPAQQQQQQQQQRKQPPQPPQPSQQKTTFRKSDPVAMFHKMQSIWSSGGQKKHGKKKPGKKAPPI
jgi:hypothetical protein